MHRAPAVHFPVKRSWWHAFGIAVLWGWGLVAAVAFLLTQRATPILWVIWSLGIVLSILLAVRGWYRSVPGVLHWDGQCWRWDGISDGTVCRLHLHLDLQRVMLVSLVDGSGHATWLWLERATDSAGWNGVRRAVISGQVRNEAQDEADVLPLGAEEP